MQSKQLQLHLPGILGIQHANALQDAGLAFASFEEAAWIALEKLQSWHESYPDDAGTAEAVQALRKALSL